MSTNPTPPVTAERMLAWCVRRDPAAACIVGDLREEYATLARSRSRTSVRRWYWVQVVGIGMRYMGRRSHQSGRTPPSSRRTNRKATPTWDIAMHHIAFAFRGLRRNPGFSAAVVVTLALGIGANATMFGVVDRLLLSPPPHVVDASQLRFLSLSGLGQRSVNSPRAYSFPDYRSIEHHPLLESAAAYAPLRWRTMNAGPDAQRVRVQRATASLFPTLGVRPEHGRFFTDADDITGAPLTAVLSFEFWEREFGRAPDVVGQTLVLGRGRYEVVGVAPAGFSGAELRAVDVWVPLQVSTGVENDWGPLDSRGAWWWRVVVRLERGVTDEAADAQLTAAHRAGIASYLEQGGRLGDDASMGALVHTGSVITARGPTASTTTAVSMWLAGVSLVVLLIACANAANLLLARGIQRRRELAIRVALGAGRKRLTLQLLTEAAMLAGVGALAALLVARWTGGAVRSMLIPGMPLIVPGTNARLFVFVLIAAALTTALAGIVPALQASRTAPADVLRNSTRGNSNAHSTLRGALTIGQITLSVVLLVVAGLFVRSLSHAAEADLGFDHDQIIVVQIEGAAGIGRDRRNELYREAQSRITGLPGVEQAVLATETIPLWGYSEQHDIRTRDNDTIPRVPGGGPYTYSGTEGFVEALGIEVVRGRRFETNEYRTGAAPVVMVSTSFARTIWPRQNPLEECVILRRGAVERDEPEPCRSVVGVYADIAVRGLVDADRLSVAWPTPPDAGGLGGILVRAANEPVDLVRSIREQVRDISADIRFVHVNLISDRVDDLLRPWRLGSTVFTAFGFLALVVAAVGLYSVMAFGVAQRQRELGIRAALGANRQDLIRLVLIQAARWVIGGLALGTAIALGAGRFIDGVLFGVEATDPSAYGIAVLTVLVAGGMAALVPAWRATSINPTRAIQAD